MDKEFDVSVVICTYNRAAMLAPAIECVLRQDTRDVRCELLVVDNNSTDETRQIIEKYIESGAARLRYIFEPRQGLSYARNTGITHARAAIIAFTDDDVRVEPDWVYKIKTTLDQHPEVAYTGGKVLPVWEREPPAWLTFAHWSPLALSDYGDTQLYVNRNRQFCLVGANLAVRRSVFEQVGMFGADFQRVKDSIGSLEDHEFQVRVWRAGMQGLYAPELVIHAEVQANRLTKEYHRRWYTGHGKYSALMRIHEITAPDGSLVDRVENTVSLFGIPAYVYRSILTGCLNSLKAFARRDESSTFEHENQIRELLSYVRKRREMHLAENQQSSFIEVAAFAKNLMQKKVMRRLGE